MSDSPRPLTEEERQAIRAQIEAEYADGLHFPKPAMFHTSTVRRLLNLLEQSEVRAAELESVIEDSLALLATAELFDADWAEGYYEKTRRVLRLGVESGTEE